MADPKDPKDEELEQNLSDQFEAYMVEIKRLLNAGVSNVSHALNSLKINGYSLSDLIAIIAGEVKTHEDDLNNPHTETLVQLGGVLATTFETNAALYFAKDAMPISKIPSLSLSTVGSILTIQPAEMIYMGRKIQLIKTTSGAMAPSNQYLKITVTGKAPNRLYSYSLTTDGSEDITKFIVATIAYSNGVWTPTPVPSVRIGAGRLSATPHGLSIPVSSGTQAAPGSINSGWIG